MRWLARFGEKRRDSSQSRVARATWIASRLNQRFVCKFPKRRQVDLVVLEYAGDVVCDCVCRVAHVSYTAISVFRSSVEFLCLVLFAWRAFIF